MIDAFLTSPDELPLAPPRRSAAGVDRGSTAPSSVTAPRTAIAAGVVLAVSLLGAAPAESTSAAKAAVSKSAPTSGDGR